MNFENILNILLIKSLQLRHNAILTVIQSHKYFYRLRDWNDHTFIYGLYNLLNVFDLDELNPIFWKSLGNLWYTRHAHTATD